MFLRTLFRAGGPTSWRSIQVCAVGWSNEVCTNMNCDGALGALCNVHCALCAAHDSPRAAKAMPMEEFVYCSRSWLRREAPVLLARSLAVNRASTPPFFGLVALVGLVTARCPLGSSAWTWVSSASTAGAVCSCEWCVRDLTYCCPLPTHGERQPEPRGIPFNAAFIATATTWFFADLRLPLSRG
jgi:hypothetical protein